MEHTPNCKDVYVLAERRTPRLGYLDAYVNDILDAIGIHSGGRPVTMDSPWSARREASAYWIRNLNHAQWKACPDNDRYSIPTGKIAGSLRCSDETETERE